MAPELATVGWKEWVALPQLGIERIKAKVDTGARTSALHASRIERFTEKGAPHARLHLHPLQRDDRTCIIADVAVIDERQVTDSGGHRERRIVIESLLSIGPVAWPIELTVTRRENVLFRMLLGRTAMQGRLLVDPSRCYVIGKRPAVRLGKK